MDGRCSCNGLVSVHPFVNIRHNELTISQLTLIATRCAVPWSQAAKTSLQSHHTLRPALARGSGSRGLSATDVVKTRLDRVSTQGILNLTVHHSPNGHNEERKRNRLYEVTKISHSSATAIIILACTATDCDRWTDECWDLQC